MSTLPKDAARDGILRAGSGGSDPYLPLIIVTAIMAGIFVIGPLVVPRGPHRGLIRVSLMLTIVSLWLFWVIIYIAQINPLMGPRMSNNTLAWVGYCWGEDPKKVARRALPPGVDISVESPPEF